MKNLLGTIFIIYIIMCLGNWNDPPPTTPPVPVLKNWKNPEPGREVDHFDEDKLEYVYIDQVSKDSAVFRWKTPPMPDVYVQIIEPNSQRTNYIPQSRKYRRTVHDQVKIGGKRYRINHKADHTQEFIPIR